MGDFKHDDASSSRYGGISGKKDGSPRAPRSRFTAANRMRGKKGDQAAKGGETGAADAPEASSAVRRRNSRKKRASALPGRACGPATAGPAASTAATANAEAAGIGTRADAGGFEAMAGSPLEGIARTSQAQQERQRTAPADVLGKRAPASPGLTPPNDAAASPDDSRLRSAPLPSRAASGTTDPSPRTSARGESSKAALDIAGMDSGRASLRRSNVRRMRSTALRAARESSKAESAFQVDQEDVEISASPLRRAASAVSKASSSLMRLLAPLFAVIIPVALLAFLSTNLSSSLLTTIAAIDEEENAPSGYLVGDAAELAYFLMNEMGLGTVQTAAIIANSVVETYDSRWVDGNPIQINFSSRHPGAGIGFLMFSDRPKSPYAASMLSMTRLSPLLLAATYGPTFDEATELKDYAALMEKDWTDPTVQLALFKDVFYDRGWTECNTSEYTLGQYNVEASREAFESEDEVGLATLIFMAAFVKPDTDPDKNHYPNRMAVAEAVLRTLETPENGGYLLLANAATIARSLTWIDAYTAGGMGPASLNWMGPKAGTRAWGGHGGFGTAAFVSYVYEIAGLGSFGAAVTDYYNFGAKSGFEEVELEDLVPGDLVVYGSQGFDIAIWLGDGYVVKSSSAAADPGVRVFKDEDILPGLVRRYLHYSKVVSDIIGAAETQLGVDYDCPGGYGTCTPYDPSFITPATRPSYTNGTSDFGSAKFDCYGLVYYAYTSSGYNLPDYGDTFWDPKNDVCMVGPVIKDQSQLVPGAIIHWLDYDHYGKHYALYVGDGQIIEAATCVRYNDLEGHGDWSAVNPWQLQ